jgi:Tol biopolymer transport system component
MRVRPRWSVEQDRAVGVSGKGPRPAELGRRILGVAALTGGVLLSVLAPTAQAAFTERVSVSSAGAEANASGSQGERISADGRYIVFTSDASNLVAGDTNSAWDIFVRDRESGETRRVSVSSSGAQANGNTYAAAITGDGRYVAFSSDASNLVAGDTNGTEDVFVYDRQSGETRRLSVSSSGAQANGPSGYGVAISDDGRYVSFSSSATSLVADDTNGKQDVFVHDLQSGVTRRVSVSSAGAEGKGNSYSADVSADGRYVCFSSTASNLVAGDTNNATDIFVYDVQSGETRRVSVSSTGTEADRASREGPSISADGRYVAFTSAARNLIADDTNTNTDIFVHDLQSGETQRVSVKSSGAPITSDSGIPAISADGRYVSFISYASSLVAGDTNALQDVFVHDRQSGETRRVSVSITGAQADGDSISGAISADGRYVTFRSGAPNLVPGDNNGTFDVFVHDLADSPLPSNAGFEADLAGWNTSGSAAGVTLTRVQGGHSGGWAARLANTAASAGTCTLNDAPNVVTTTAAAGYTAWMWVRADVPGQTLKLRLREYHGATLLGSATSQVVLTTAWQPVMVGYAPTAPGASTLDLNAYVSGASPGTCFRADDAAIEPTPPPPPPPPIPPLVPNPGFEADLFGWNTSGSSAGVTLTRVPGGPGGAWTARLANTAATAGMCTLNDAPNLITTTTAGSYAASMWVSTDIPGQTFKLRLREYSGANLVGSAMSQVVLATTWQLVAVTYAPAAPGASTLDLNAYVSGAPPGTCFFADNVAIQHD